MRSHFIRTCLLRNKGDEAMIIILFTLLVIIVVSVLGIKEDLDSYEEFDRKKEGSEINGLFNSDYLIFNPSGFGINWLVATDFIRG